MHMARILITEDEDSLRVFVARALRLDGHETEEAA
jgi:two-component system cell cycle response regulator CpdR